MYIATTEAASSSPILTDGQVLGVTVGIGVISLVVVLLPFWLARAYNKQPQPATTDIGPRRPASFFEIPYITWFIVHYGIASLAILAIVLLGVDNVIDKGTVSALLGSLFGYVLGSAGRSSQGTGAPASGKPVAPSPTTAQSTTAAPESDEAGTAG